MLSFTCLVVYGWRSTFASCYPAISFPFILPICVSNRSIAGADRVCSPLTLYLTMAIVSVPHSLFARPWPVCRCVCVALRCVAFQLRAAIWTRRTPPSSPSRHGTARQPPHNSPSPTLLLFSSNNRVLVVFCACTCVYMCVCVCIWPMMTLFATLERYAR